MCSIQGNCKSEFEFVVCEFVPHAHLPLSHSRMTAVEFWAVCTETILRYNNAPCMCDNQKGVVTFWTPSIIPV